MARIVALIDPLKGTPKIVFGIMKALIVGLATSGPSPRRNESPGSWDAAMRAPPVRERTSAYGRPEHYTDMPHTC